MYSLVKLKSDFGAISEGDNANSWLFQAYIHRSDDIHHELFSGEPVITTLFRYILGVLTYTTRLINDKHQVNVTF